MVIAPSIPALAAYICWRKFESLLGALLPTEITKATDALLVALEAAIRQTPTF